MGGGWDGRTRFLYRSWVGSSDFHFLDSLHTSFQPAKKLNRHSTQVLVVLDGVAWGPLVFRLATYAPVASSEGPLQASGLRFKEVASEGVTYPESAPRFPCLFAFFFPTNQANK